MKQAILRSALITISLAVSTAMGQIPQSISYQGLLSDTLGNPKKDSTYTLTFRLYSVESGGSAVWSETKSLPTFKGIFQTALGDQSPFGASVSFNEPYWLGISLDAGAEFTPRITLSSVGYSFRALSAGVADDIADGIVSTAKIADNAITTIKLADASITASKIADGTVGAAKIDPAGATAGQVLSYDGEEVSWSEIQSGAGDISAVIAGDGLDGGGLSGEVSLAIDSAGVTSTHILDGTIGNSDLATDAVDSGNITDGSLLGNDLADGQVLRSLNTLTDDVVLATSGGATITTSGDSIIINAGGGSESGIFTIENNDGVLNITNPNGPVTTIDLNAASISTAQLADAAVTTPKIADLSVNTNKINPTGATSGDVLSYDGEVVLWSAPATGSGDITGVIAGSGLAGGGFTGDVTLAVDSAGIEGVHILDGSIESADIADGEVVRTINNLADNIIFSAEGGATITTNGDSIIINAGSGGGETGIFGIQNTNNTLTITDPNGPTTTINVADQGITSTQLADEAVTNTKLAADAVTSAEIADGAVGTVDLQDGAVSTGKISPAGAQNNQVITFDGEVVSWSDVPGGGSGDITAVTAGTGLSGGGDTGDVSLAVADNGITTTQILDGTISNADIGSNTINTQNITDGTIGNADLADNSVNSANIVDGTIGNADLADNSVNSANIVDGTIGNADLADNSVNSANIADGAVGSTEVADGSLTGNDLADGEVIRSINALNDNIILSAEGGATITTSGDSIIINAGSGGGGTGIQGIQNTNSTLDIINPNGPTTTINIAAGGVGSTEIADAAVGNAEIADAAVNTVKIDPAGASSGQVLSYNGETVIWTDVAGGNGDITAVTAGDGLTGGGDTGDVSLAIGTGAVTSTHIADATITATDLAANAVTTPTIIDDAVTNAKLADNAVASAEISDSGVATVDLADDAVTNAKLADNAVASAEISDGGVATVDLADNAVSTIKIDPAGASSGQVLSYDGESVTWSDVAGGNGDITSVTAGAGLTGGGDTGDISLALAIGGVASAHIQDGTIQNLDIGSSTINSLNIIDGTIDNEDLGASSVDLSKIDPTASTGDQYIYYDGEAVRWQSVTAGTGDITSVVAGTGLSGGGTSGDVTISIAANGISSSLILDGTIMTEDLGIESVGGTNIAAGAVDNTHLASQAVSTDKIDPGGAGVDTYLKYDGQNIIWDTITGSSADDDWLFSGSNIYRLTGNVGIGTSAPFSQLTLTSSLGFTNSTSPMMYIYESGTLNSQRPIFAHSPGFPTWGLAYRDTEDKLIFQSGGTPVMAVALAGGEVTIGTDQDTATAQLTVIGSQFNGAYFETKYLPQTGEISGAILGDHKGTTDVSGVGVHGRAFNREFGVGTGGYFEGSGIGVFGVSNEASTGNRFGVVGWAQDGSINTGVYGLALGQNSEVNYGVLGWAINSETAVDWGVYSNGDLGYTGELINVQPLNELTGIQSLENGLAKVMQLKPSTYSYKTDAQSRGLSLPTGKQTGFIAAEVEAVMPELISDGRTADPAGIKELKLSGSPQDYKGINLDGMLPYLVKAIQEQQLQIAEQQKIIDEQKQVLEALQRQVNALNK